MVSFRIYHKTPIRVTEENALEIVMALYEVDISMYEGDNSTPKFDKTSFPEETDGPRCWAIAVDGKEIRHDLDSKEASLLFYTLVKVYFWRK